MYFFSNYNFILLEYVKQAHTYTGAYKGFCLGVGKIVEKVKMYAIFLLYHNYGQYMLNKRSSISFGFWICRFRLKPDLWVGC